MSQGFGFWASWSRSLSEEQRKEKTLLTTLSLEEELRADGIIRA